MLKTALAFHSAKYGFGMMGQDLEAGLQTQGVPRGPESRLKVVGTGQNAGDFENVAVAVKKDLV